MNIAPVSNSYGKSIYANKMYSARQNFKGSLTDIETRRVLDMLKPTVTEIKCCNDLDELKTTINTLAKKFESWGVSSIGTMIVPEKDLISFTNDRLSQKDIAGKMGLCVAAGDKYGPVESWNEVYETKLLLMPKVLFRRNNCNF